MQNRPGMETEQRRLGRAPWRLAVAFVILTLVALSLVPWLVQRRVNALRARIGSAEPARTLVTRWQFHLVREIAAIDEMLLSGDTTELRVYLYSASRERATSAQLEQLAVDLGPTVVAAVARARALSDRWHTRVSQEQVRTIQGRTRLTGLPRELELFNEVLEAVSNVDSAIAVVGERNLAAIRSAERAGIVTTFILGALALIASAAVVGIEARVRRFAAEAERRRAETEAALAETARVEEARARLIRGITHDVKNPLGAARGYTELLTLEVKAPLADEQKPLVEGVERSINQALAIIDDLLEVSRAESGTLSLNPVRVDLNELAHAALDAYRASARAAGHTVEFRVLDGTLSVTTDTARVRQVLDNLLTNAIKYTPAPGTITVMTNREERGDPGIGPWATVAVADNGPGIPAEAREAIFEEYTRLERTSAEGHGLGLAIARRLARRLGGDLTLADTGPGATFVLWLPMRER